ncbi:aerobic respiration-related protein [Nannochloropsis oceanica]
MFRSSTVALLRRAAASPVPLQQHQIVVSLMPRNGASAMAAVVCRQLAAPSSVVMRSLVTHAGSDAMPNGDMPVGTGAGGRSSTSAALADLLGRELQEEKELVENEDRAPELEEVSDKIHKRFHIKESPGSSIIKMHTKHDLEKILVQFDVQDTTEDELDPQELDGEKIEDYTVGVRGVVSIAKAHHKLMFSLVFTNTVWVEKVAFDSQGREWDDETLYWSDFSEYPEDVQDAFTRYLAARHIDEELAVFVSYFAYEKEKEHYVDFLEEVTGFVGAK